MKSIYILSIYVIIFSTAACVNSIDREVELNVTGVQDPCEVCGGDNSTYDLDNVVVNQKQERNDENARSYINDLWKHLKITWIATLFILTLVWIYIITSKTLSLIKAILYFTFLPAMFIISLFTELIRKQIIQAQIEFHAAQQVAQFLQERSELLGENEEDEIRDDDDDEKKVKVPNQPKEVDVKISDTSNVEKICVICQENERKCLLNDCGHYGFCFSCVKKLKSCPTCRKDIVGGYRQVFIV